MQRELFDQSGRDEAVDAVANAHPEWRDRFRKCVKQVANGRRPFTTDTVLSLFPELEECKEKRVFGAVMLALAREGYLKPLGYAESTRKASHARPKRQWILKE